MVYAWNRMDGRSPLWIASVDGSIPRRVAEDGWMPLRESPAGNGFYAARITATGEAIEIVLLPLDGGAPRSLLGLPLGMRALDVSRDGRTLLLASRQQQSDVWEVTLPADR